MGIRMTTIPAKLLGSVIFVCALSCLSRPVTAAHPWPHGATETVEERVAPPKGWHRVPVRIDHFGHWARTLPVKNGRGTVRLHNGKAKWRQDIHVAVLDIDIGRHNLQQCADLAIRLHAEWTRHLGQSPCYRFTSGDPAPWSKWSAGFRPLVRGRRVLWTSRSQARADYTTFRSWLKTVFTYAGSASVARDTKKVRGPVEPGDLFVQGGFPGHVVVVLDVVSGPNGERSMLLAQSYMPAQSPHILLRVGHEHPWYPQPAPSEELETPEWTFPPGSLRRFPKDPCS